ncbi:DUF4942 domain-containing protein [Mesorhizobium sp. M7A.F.Ca.MR.148.00.0.0]|uniref:DUF4942 domain-containing protein n=1 Tax=Mesorhizobium sp. M7A.F.Ca.MR.148.00.0.0 TaxID=2496775 RepID=UPI000FCB4F9E|nr:DUF4942 domain-containing protein [Mesorhizobium sp. M7A.F.Ca.MR.148.00.0.0]RUV37438.1 DUF4942 domain-containing protein [Mesorhizobium sp. M7A.F.Ca.MR.148.00.0.0]
MNALIPRNTVEQIVAYRDAAVAAYHGAFASIEQADRELKKAAALWKAAAGDHASSRYGDRDNHEVRAFFEAVDLPDAEQWKRTAIRLIDISCWNYLVKMTDLEVLMDKQAKDELRDTLKWVPERYNHRHGDGKELVNLDEIMGIPPVTVDNIYATIDKWAGESEMIFRRGIATAFSKLDRRFRSHDGFKVGSRMILTYAFDRDHGHVSYGGTWETVRDIERTFSVLDGKKPSYNSIENVVRAERKGFNPQQSEHHGEYFRILAYKNGNAHLWFTRDDLVVRVNKMLAEYYGEVIGDGQTQEPDDLFRNRKTTPAKNFGFFPTPDGAAEELIKGIPLLQPIEKPRLTVLEPSAGTGNLARRCVSSIKDFSDHYGYGQADRMDRWRKEYRFDNQVDCVEMQGPLAAALQAQGIYRKVYAADFLSLRPSVTGLYDRIVMNPPFDIERDIDHVVHALDFLEDDGCLAAIMSAGTEFRETRKAIAFRALIEKLNGSFHDLPHGSFAEVGTYVNTVTVKVWKNGRRNHF